jgi:hypothetical protein
MNPVLAEFDNKVVRLRTILQRAIEAENFPLLTRLVDDLHDAELTAMTLQAEGSSRQ